MPYIIPETMPEDWALFAAEDGISPDQGIIVAMRQAYTRVLEEADMVALHQRLRQACVDAAVRASETD